MSKLDPRARFRMAILLLVVLPVLPVWLFASIGETRIPEFVRMIFAAAYYHLGLLDWGPLAQGALLTLIVGLVLSFVSVLRKAWLFGVLGLLAPTLLLLWSLAMNCPSSMGTCVSQSFVLEILPMLLAPGIILGLAAFFFAPVQKT